MKSNTITEQTHQRLQERAARQGCSVDALLNQLLDALPEDDLPPALYKRLLDNTSDTISVFDLDLRYRYTNPIMGRLLGVPVDDIIGKTDRELGVTPELVEGLTAIWQQVIDTRQERITRFDYWTPNGQRYFESRLTPIENNNGDIDYLLSITRDVTEHVRTTGQLRLHSEILANAHEGVHLIRVGQGTFLYVNPALERMFGYEPGEMLGQHVSILNAPTDEDPVAIANQIMQALHVTGVWQGEIRNRRKDGTTFWSRAQVTTFNHAEYGPVWVSLHEDITARKQAEDALRESEKKYRLIAENTSDGIFIMDGQTRRMTYVSPAYARMTGRTLDDTLNDDVDTIYNLLHLEDRDAVFAEIGEALARHADSLTYTFRAQRPDGSYYWREDHAHFNYAPDGTYLSAYVIARDITERKQAEDALRESERRLSTLMDNLPGMVYRCTNNPDWPMTFVSSGCYDLTGYAAEQFTSDNPLHYGRVVHPEDRARVFDTVQAALARQQPFEIEYRIITADNAEKYVWERGRGDFEQGELQFLEGFIIDVTERKRAAEALGRSEARLRSIVETQTAFVIRTDMQGNYTYVNGAFFDRYRWRYARIEDVLGTSSMETILPEDQDKAWQTVMNCLNDPGTPYQVTLRKPSADGGYFWTLWEFVALADMIGLEQEIQCVGIDITEQMEARHKLRLQENALLAAANAIVITDRNAHIEWVNPAFTHLTGYTLAEALGKNPNALVKSGAHNDAFYKAMWSTILGGDVWFGRLINRRKNGTLYTEEQTITPITDEQGEIAHFIAIKQDVTERLRHEAFALENERLKLRVRQEKEQNMRVQQTVSALAHDLRTPLTVISTSKDILTRYSDRISATQRQEKLDAIERQLQFVLELLDDLVMVVKGNLNERSFHPSPVNLPVLCQATIDEVTETQAAAHEVIFSNPEAVEMVTVDEILISRILLNLLSNAIKYSPDAGQIRLELDRYAAGVVLRVIDQGMGISADALPRIFEPFFRAQPNEEIPGSGLGLSIVKDCVDRHHGQIRVESQPGQGTTFIVELPVAESIAAQDEDRQPE